MTLTATDTAVVLPTEIYELLTRFAHTEGKPVNDFAGELLAQSLGERERQKEEKQREGVLRELVAQSEELGLYDDVFRTP